MLWSKCHLQLNGKIGVCSIMCRIFCAPVLSPGSFGIKPFQADKSRGMSYGQSDWNPVALLSLSSLICCCLMQFSKSKGGEHCLRDAGLGEGREFCRSSGFITRQTKMMDVQCCFSFVLKCLEADGDEPTFLSSRGVLHPSDNARFSPIVT